MSSPVNFVANVSFTVRDECSNVHGSRRVETGGCIAVLQVAPRVKVPLELNGSPSWHWVSGLTPT